jgi:hypothetical protein
MLDSFQTFPNPEIKNQNNNKQQSNSLDGNVQPIESDSRNKNSNVARRRTKRDTSKDTRGKIKEVPVDSAIEENLEGNQINEVSKRTIDPDPAIDVSKNASQREAALDHMIYDRDWREEWLTKFGVVFLTYEQATTPPYRYSATYTSSWGGWHFPLARFEPDCYYGQLYNWWPNKKCQAEDRKKISFCKNSENETSKYVTAKPNGNKLFILDPIKYLDQKTEKPIVAITEDLQGVYQMCARTHERFVANTIGCNGVLNSEIDAIRSGKEIKTELAKLFKLDVGVFIFDNDVFTNFGVFHAALKVLLYGNCNIKVLSKDVNEKVGLDEFARSGKTILDYRELPEYNFTDFLSDNKFNFIKNRYSTFRVFELVENIRGGAARQLVEKVFYGETSDLPLLTLRSNQTWKDKIKEVEKILSNILDIRNIYRNNIGDLFGVIQEGLNCKSVLLDVNTLRRELNNLINFKQEKFKDGKTSHISIDCPKELSEELFYSLRKFRVKELERISRVPMLTHDGDVIAKSGYYDSIKTIITIDDSECKCTNMPTKNQAKESLNYLKSILGEFDFKTINDQSAALAMLLTGVSRHLYKLSPGFAVNANVPETGKSALINVLNYMLTGCEARCIGWAQEEEMNKKILTSLMQSHQVINIDNVKGTVSNANWESSFTSGYFNGRLLGLNKDFDANAQIIWTINGNNLEYSNDLKRRLLMIGLTRKSAASRDFAIVNFEAYLSKNQNKMLDSALTVVSAFLKRDKNEDMVWPVPVASFGDWDRVVRRCLLWLGEEDPWVATQDYAKSDESQARLGEFLDKWYKVFGSKSITGSELAKCLTEKQKEVEAMELYEYLSMLDKVYERDNNRINTRQLGRYLSKLDGSMAWGYRLDRVGVAHQAIQYSVTKDS